MRRPLRTQDPDSGSTVFARTSPEDPSLQTQTQSDLLGLLLAQATLLESQLYAA